MEHNCWGALLEAEEELAQAEMAVRSIELTPRANAASKHYAYRTLQAAQHKVHALAAECEADNERIEAAILERQGAAAVETAERIIAAARTVAECTAAIERTVRVWTYEDPEYPTVWTGEAMTVADTAKVLAERAFAGKPRVTRTWEGYWSFAFEGGQRIVIKGATPNELRSAYRAISTAVMA